MAQQETRVTHGCSAPCCGEARGAVYGGLHLQQRFTYLFLIFFLTVFLAETTRPAERNAKGAMIKV